MSRIVVFPFWTCFTILFICSASFEWFRNRCDLNLSINENKELLKCKIEEAKQLGERANQSR